MTMTKANLDAQIAQLSRGEFDEGELTPRMMECITDLRALNETQEYSDEQMQLAIKLLVKDWHYWLEEGYH